MLRTKRVNLPKFQKCYRRDDTPKIHEKESNDDTQIKNDLVRKQQFKVFMQGCNYQIYRNFNYYYNQDDVPICQGSTKLFIRKNDNTLLDNTVITSITTLIENSLHGKILTGYETFISGIDKTIFSPYAIDGIDKEFTYLAKSIFWNNLTPFAITLTWNNTTTSKPQDFFFNLVIVFTFCKSNTDGKRKNLEIYHIFNGPETFVIKTFKSKIKIDDFFKQEINTGLLTISLLSTDMNTIVWHLKENDLPNALFDKNYNDKIYHLPQTIQNSSIMMLKEPTR